MTRPFPQTLRPLRNQRGTLYEIPILIVLFLVVLAVVVPAVQKHGWKGLLAMLFLLLGLALLVALAWGLFTLYDRVVLPSKSLALCLEYFFGIAVRVLAGGFLLMILDGFLFVIYGQQGVMDIVVPCEGLGLLAFSVWHTWHGRRKKKVTGDEK